MRSTLPSMRVVLGTSIGVLLGLAGRPLLRFLAVSGILLACLVSHAEAQDELQYKFKVGDSFRYESDFKTGATAQGGVAVRIELQFEGDWSVTAVDAGGKAKITLKVSRVRFSAFLQGGEVHFDSQNKKPAEAAGGQMAVIFAPFLNSVTGLEITITVDPQGTITDLKLPKKLLAGLREMHGGPGTGETFASEGFAHFLTLAIQPLPKGASAKGNAWERTADFRMRSGQMKIETKYTDAGPERRDGKQLRRISVKPTLSIGKGRIAAIVSVKSQKVPAGFFLFDPAAGRLVEYRLTQDVEQEVPFGDTKQLQDVHSTWVVKMLDKAK